MKINGDISDDEIKELVRNHKLTIGRVNKAVRELYLTEGADNVQTVYAATSKDKTIKQWFKEGLKGKTLVAALKEPMGNGNYSLDDVVKSLPQALSQSFSWRHSVMGRSFWERVYGLALNNICLCEDNIHRTEKVKQHKCKVCGKPVKL